MGRPIQRADSSLYYSANVDNKANRECVKFFSISLKTAKTYMNAVLGQTSSTKTVEIHHHDPEG